MQMNSKLAIGTRTAPNRLLMPPLVCFNWADDFGYETVSRADHYGARARGGAGIVVIEATAISQDSRLCRTELGLWEDGHIDQFSKMAEAIHEPGSISLVQLVHAGEKATNPKATLDMTHEDFEEVKEDFVKASLRAERAGLMGVEIHGAHGYLLSQMAASAHNKRTDQYGRDLKGRMRLALEVVSAVKKAVGPDFIVGYRYGAMDPTFEEDGIFVRELEAAGVDFLNVSVGIMKDAEALTIPKDYPYSEIVYMGQEVKKIATVPVACVNGIRDPEVAKAVLDAGIADVVAVGRGFLADPLWGTKAMAGQVVNRCYHCKPRCHFGIDGHKCPQSQAKSK